MSERLISQLQSFLDRLKNDSRSALMFEADGDTLREAMARIKADGMKVDHMMIEADKDVIRIAALERDLAAAQAKFHSHLGERDAETFRANKAEAEAAALRVLLLRYRNEVPLGHQPHMIAHLVDAAIDQARGAADD